jgi:hypothetical protein
LVLRNFDKSDWRNINNAFQKSEESNHQEYSKDSYLERSLLFRLLWNEKCDYSDKRRPASSVLKILLRFFNFKSMWEKVLTWKWSTATHAIPTRSSSNLRKLQVSPILTFAVNFSISINWY